MDKFQLAVNGTLMRGFALNENLVAAGAEFIRATTTAPAYRLWSVGDAYPAMQYAADGGASIEVEIWQVGAEGLLQILRTEPPGLCLGRVQLADGGIVLGVLGEAYICAGQREITEYGGWRGYWRDNETNNL
jgi:hypothetical protein